MQWKKSPQHPPPHPHPQELGQGIWQGFRAFGVVEKEGENRIIDCKKDDR